MYSSPGKTRSRSPTWTIPLHTRPDTPRPEDNEVWPLNTFEIGTRSGESSERSGGSSWSAKGIKFVNYFLASRDLFRTKEVNKCRAIIPCHRRIFFGFTDKVYACHGADGHKLHFGRKKARLQQKGAEVFNYDLVAFMIPINLTKTSKEIRNHAI